MENNNSDNDVYYIMSNEGFFTDDIDDQTRYRRSRINNANRNMIRRNDTIPDIYEDEYEDDDEEIHYCPHCLEFGMQNKLGAKIIPYGEKPKSDHDLWMSCYICGNTFPKHEIEKQKNLQVGDLKEHVMENAFEAGQTLIESVPKRTSPAGQKAAAKRRRERDRPHHKDKEIDREIQQHGEDNVHIIQDTDP